MRRKKMKSKMTIENKTQENAFGWCSNKMDKRHEIPIYFKLKCKFVHENQTYTSIHTHSIPITKKKNRIDDQIQWDSTNEQIQSNVDNILSPIVGVMHCER